MAQTFLALTEDELRRVIRDEVSAALHEHAGKPKLLDRTRLAQQLCCSPSHVDTLRGRGLPTIYVGESPRFELNEVLTWMRQNKVD